MFTAIIFLLAAIIILAIQNANLRTDVDNLIKSNNEMAEYLHYANPFIKNLMGKQQNNVQR